MILIQNFMIVLERVWKIIPTNCDAHLAESIFQTYSGKIILLKVREDNIKKWNKKMLRLFLTSREQKKKIKNAQAFSNQPWAKKKIKNAQSRNRTSDTRIFSPLLYQLSYLGISSGDRIWTYDLRVMSPTSFQTAPPRVTIWYCIQLLSKYTWKRMDGGGFEPPKQLAADLQSDP